MKEYDRIILKVEKEQYAKDGVHKGMDGWICDPRNIEGTWLVCFDQDGALPNIACIAVNEEDMDVLVSHVHHDRYAEVIRDKEEYAVQGVRKGMFGKLLFDESTAHDLMIEFTDDKTEKTFKVAIKRDDLIEHKIK